MKFHDERNSTPEEIPLRQEELPLDDRKKIADKKKSWIPDQITQRFGSVGAPYSGVLKGYGKLILVTLLSIFLALAGIPPIVDLRQRINALDFQRSEAREEYQEALSERDEIIQDLSEILNSPIPRDPPSGTRELQKSVELRWEPPEHLNAPAIRDYSVEVIYYGLNKQPKEQYQKVSNPDAHVHQFDIEPGAYMWRVAAEPGDPNVPRTEGDQSKSLRGLWSGYSFFSVSLGSKESAPASELRVGINFSQHSPFMTRSPKNIYCGFDAELIEWIGKRLQRGVKLVEYPSVPALLTAAREGHVDIAIGSITHTRRREEEGNAFSHGYTASPPVLACKRSDSACNSLLFNYGLLRGDGVGVIGATTNEDAAKELQKTFGFILKPVFSFQSLISMLDTGKTHFIIVDQPFVQYRCNSPAPDRLRCFSLPRDLLTTYRKALGDDRVEEYAMAIDDATLRAQVNEALASARMSGELATLTKKYLSTRAPCSSGTTISQTSPQ